MKKTGPAKGTPYTVPPELWCGARKKNGQLCRMAKMKGAFSCHRHDPNMTTAIGRLVPGGTRTLDDRPLETVHDVIKFLSALMMQTKNNQINHDIADMLDKQCKTLLMAMKLRAGAKDGKDSASQIAAAIVLIQAGMSPEEAKKLLLEKDFLETIPAVATMPAQGEFNDDESD